MPDLEKFGRYEISRDSSGKPIELYQARGETICLAYDTGKRSLIELHLLQKPAQFTSFEHHCFFERFRMVRALRGDAGFSAVLKGDTLNGNLFYTANINNGEPIAEYVRRMGPIPVETALGLAVDLSERLSKLTSKFQRVLSSISLNNAMLMVGEGGNLTIRVVDFGLATEEPDPSLGDSRLVREFAWMLLTMMTGQERPADGDTDSKIKLGGLPLALRRLIKDLLTGSVSGPLTLTSLDSALQEAFKSVQRSFLARTQRRHLVVSSKFYPRTTLERHLIPDPAFPTELSDRFRDDERAFGPKDPFRRHLVEPDTGDRVGMQILPPFRIISSQHYTPIPPQLDEADMAQYPHLMDVFEGWESNSAIYLAEENWPGFTLPYLLRIKGRLKPVEALVLLRQVVHGLNQAAKCGIDVRQVRPRDFQVCFQQRTTQADLRQLLERRIEMWPTFVVKLRTHAAIRALIQPESEIESAIVDLKQSHPELLHQRFIALAIELLTGKTGELPRESLPDGLFSLFEKCGRDIRENQPVLAPSELVEAFATSVEDAPEEPAFRSYLWAGAPNGKVVETPDSNSAKTPDEQEQDIPETVAIGIKRRAFYKGELVDEESGQVIPAAIEEGSSILFWDGKEFESRFDPPLGVGEAMLAAAAQQDGEPNDELTAEVVLSAAETIAEPDDAPKTVAFRKDQDLNPEVEPPKVAKAPLGRRLASATALVAQVAAILLIPLFIFVGIPDSDSKERHPSQVESTEPAVEEAEKRHQPITALIISTRNLLAAMSK